ncbi:MAG TPA: DinB family protein [Vicinamibacterales bacterium]|nr:DinB family protein [Vicinamibacterales bacterium]
MKTALDHVLRHNTWANGTLFDFCRSLDPARLDDQAAGTYGTLYGTLQHLVGGEQWYVWLITGELQGARIRRDERHSLDELAAIAAATGERTLVIAASDDPDRQIAVDADHSTVGTVLAQLVHHGNEHRTQATTILGASGIEPPEISAWAYGRAVGISDHD